MAAFNPEVKPNNDPSYLGYSRELERPRANNTLGNLFEGIGDVVSLGTAAVDNTIQEGIKNDVTASVDKIRGDTGVDPVAELYGTGGKLPNGDTPPNAPGVQKAMQGLTEAWKQGKLRDTDYYGKLEAMTRQIRAKYPGYRSEVDAMVARTTGVNPANALMNAIQAEFNSAQKQIEKKQDAWESYKERNQKYFPADYWSNPEKYTQDQLKAYVGVKERENAEVTATNARLEMESKNNKLTQDNALAAYSRRIEQTVDNTISEGLQAANFDSFLKDIAKKSQSGIKLTPDDKELITAKFNTLRGQTLMAIRSAWTQKFDPTKADSGSFSTVITDLDGRRKVEGDAMKRIDDLQENVFSEKYGLIAAEQRIIKANKDQEESRLWTDPRFKGLVRGGAVRDKIGDIGLQEAIRQAPDLGTAITNSVRDYMITSSATGDGSLNDAILSLKEESRRKYGKSDGKGAFGVIMDTYGTFNNSTISPETRLNIGRTLVKQAEASQNAVFQFEKDDRYKVFAAMSDPQTSKNMFELGKTDPKLYQEYKDFVAQTTAGVLKPFVDSVNGIVRDRQNIQASWDESKGQIVVTDTDSAKLGGKLNPLSATESYLTGQAREEVDKANLVLRNLQALAKIEGKDGAKEIGALMSQYGLLKNVNPESSFWKGLLKVFGLTPEGAGNMEKAKDLPMWEEGSLDADFQATRTAGLESATDVKSAIAQGESGGNYNRLVYGNKGFVTPPETNLTNMSLKDVLAYQEGMQARGHASTAVGKYQVLKGTLRDAIKGLGLDPEQKYDPDTQEKIADWLLERRGYADYKSGKLSKDRFLSNLADEWQVLQLDPRYRDKVASLL